MIRLRAWVLCAAALTAALAARADTTQISVDQGRQMMLAAHQKHDAPLARDLALALLQRDPNDPVALAVLAAAYFALNDFPASEAAGRKAYRYGASQTQLHDSARIVAEALFRQHRLGAARTWLRRAASHATDAGMRASDERAFRGLARMQRLHWRLDGSIAPSNNINNGSSSDTLVLYGLPFKLSPDAQALSGVVADLDFDATYHLTEDKLHRLSLGLSVSANHNWLSRDAELAAPYVRGADYDLIEGEAGLTYDFRLPDSRGPYQIAAVLGRDWYGGQPLADYVRLGLAKKFLSKAGDRQITLFGTATDLTRLDSAQRSSQQLTFGTDFARVRANKDQVHLQFSLERNWSQSREIDHKAVHLSAGYTFASLIPHAEFTTSVELSKMMYDQSSYRAGGRDDLSATLDLSFFLKDIQYMGFAPVVTLSGGVVQSDVSLFDRHDTAISLGFRSTF